MTVDDGDIPTLDDLMEAAGTSLTELQIGFFKLGDGSKEFDNVLDVSPCTNLRSLRFRSPATYPLRRSLDWDESCCIIAEFLEQSEEPQIEQIAFDLTKDDIDGLRSSTAWQDVIDVLMSRRSRP
ncbi:hypothetical protein A0H81_12549 [Grifola frondosa]|uniref:Uncharacterized protein n=1 Tax=Grifola frondosa TaxID=5627 RepID=A0A1C7LTR8_GRIFR|nr:hypothetical protein A0H81_12549 [Grifola frondosa]